MLDILESTTTKRDAKSYLNKFGQRAERKLAPISRLIDVNHGVNLGDLYGYENWSAGKARHSPTSQPDAFVHDQIRQTTHVALVKIRGPEFMSDKTISGICRTLSQLAKLGMLSVVVIGPADEQYSMSLPTFRSHDQVSKIVDGIQASGDFRAQDLGQIIDVSSEQTSPQKDGLAGSSCRFRVVDSGLLYASLARGILPVIGPIGFSSVPRNHLVSVRADDTILALVGELAGHLTHQKPISEDVGANHSVESTRNLISLDRIIVLDPLGGIPRTDLYHAPHAYVNIEQEFEDIISQLEDPPSAMLNKKDIDYHIQNLALLKDALMLLPPSSSGLIATPEEVANSESQAPVHSTGPRVRTRRRRNPLIHNLLTDKPAVSSSLPYGRSLPLGKGGTISTFVKRGMPVIMIPDPRIFPWKPPSGLDIPLSLSNSHINLTRLVSLIEASFRRKLDVNHYLSRMQNRFAGLIVAGDYEGCALFTWESPPNTLIGAVPYLDKFAVLPRSQGTGTSVADVLFKCMVRDCFPRGVCWRSRANNPVNKWYFERAKGAWKMPGTQWTSFWTTENPSRNELAAYEAVCQSVQPSWAGEILS